MSKMLNIALSVLLSMIASTHASELLLPHARDDLRSCLAAAVNGDAARTQFPDEPGFVDNDVKYFNLNLQHKPFGITYPNTAQEISDVVKCASKYKRKLQPRSGGRDFLNKCLGGADDAVVVDLTHFRQLDVDEKSGIAKVGPGNILRDLVEGLNDKGRYMPHGSSPTVGIGGHVAVGGIGYMSRENGIAVDVLREIQVVLANGTVVRASEDQYQDLFWAMRGAGASFGIGTEYTFQTMPMPTEVVTWAYNYTSKDPTTLSAAVKAFAQMMKDPSMPRKLSASGILTRDSFYISGSFYGSENDLNALDLGGRLPAPTEKQSKAGVTWMQYMDGLFQSASSLPAQAHMYARDTALSYESFPSDESIAKWVSFLMESSETNWGFLIDWYGGAVNDVPADATPFPHRNLVGFVTGILSTEGMTSETSMSFIDKAFLTLQDNKPEKYLSYAGVPNMRLGANPQAKYWGTNLERLERIKAAIDPQDLFSTPQNIKPITI